MFAASLNLEAFRVCPALGCGKPLPQELPADAKYCSDSCKEREEQRQRKATKG